MSFTGRAELYESLQERLLGGEDSALSLQMTEKGVSYMSYDSMSDRMLFR